MEAFLGRRHITLYTRAFAAAFVFILLLPGVLYSCSLVQHDWQLISHISLNISSPLFPFAETDLLLKGQFRPTKNILWVTPDADSLYAKLTAYCVPIYFNILDNLDFRRLIVPETTQPYASLKTNLQWCKEAKWIPVAKGPGLKSALDQLGAENCLVIGSDNTNLKAAIFADKLSDYKCKQILLVQNNRIRGVQLGSDIPIATEINGTAYASCVYFGDLVNKLLMNYSVYPVAGVRAYPYQDQLLISSLINNSLVTPLVGTGREDANVIPSIP